MTYNKIWKIWLALSLWAVLNACLLSIVLKVSLPVIIVEGFIFGLCFMAILLFLDKIDRKKGGSKWQKD